jgi:hypothetical protein
MERATLEGSFAQPGLVRNFCSPLGSRHGFGLEVRSRMNRLELD